MYPNDKSTRFFHNSIKGRKIRSVITSLEDDHGRVEGVVEIKEAVKSYFESFFKESNILRPITEGIDFKSISENDREWLGRSFSKEGVKDAV